MNFGKKYKENNMENNMENRSKSNLIEKKVGSIKEMIYPPKTKSPIAIHAGAIVNTQNARKLATGGISFAVGGAIAGNILAPVLTGIGFAIGGPAGGAIGYAVGNGVGFWGGGAASSIVGLKILKDKTNESDTRADKSENQIKLEVDIKKDI